MPSPSPSAASPPSGQSALTVLAPIQPGQTASLNALLTELGTDPGDHPKLRFHDVPTLHFACFVILDQDPAYPPCLVFESNLDGDLESHVQQLLSAGKQGFDEIFAHCRDYPIDPNPMAAQRYLLAHSVSSPAFYVGLPGQTVADLRNAISVREDIQTFLDQEQGRGALRGLSAGQILARIQQHLVGPGAVIPRVSSEGMGALRRRSQRNTWLLALFCLPLLILSLPLLIPWILLLRLRECIDNRRTLPPLDPDPRLFEHPDIRTQSHLTTLCTVRPGAIRLFTLRLVLGITSLLARTVAIAGNLLGIPTIHFARWILMDDNRRLLFFSNYDGSWTSYIGDFVDKAKLGLTAVWGHTDRFPPSRWLVLGGAAYIAPFSDWSHQHNVFAPLYYRAYPSATVADLINDIEIRDQVGRPMDEAEAAAFLQRF